MSYFETPGEAAVSVAKHLMQDGLPQFVGDVKTYELINYKFTILSPDALPFNIERRGLNHDIARIETLSLFAESPVDHWQRLLSRGLASFQDENVQWGNYGARIRGQVAPIVEKLRGLGNRQAVISIYDGPRDLLAKTKDTPCTMTLQFLSRDNRLHLIVNMRSNDVFLGLPYDLHQFCFLQTAMAQVCGLDVGHYHHNVGSMHMYARNDDAVENMGESHEIIWPATFSFEDHADMVEYAHRVLHTNLEHAITPTEKWLANLGEQAL